MILADLCVRRPVFATMFVGALVVLGWFSYMRLGVDLFPKVDMPTVMVTTFLPGAAPEEAEARVTKPIEEAVNTISGIDEMRSNTLEGVSRVIIEFKLERSLDAAMQDVRDRISTVLDQLPDGTKPPLVQKFDFDAVPVVTLTVTGYQSLKELTELARRRLKEPLESVDGVGSIDIVGGREREIHVDVDADKLHATGVTIQQVGAALSRQNVEYPGGRIMQGMSEEMLRTLGRITEVPDFAKVIVSEAEGRPVTVGDVASVEDGVKEPRSLSRWDNKNAVSLVVRKQSGENTIAVVDRVRERYDTIKGALPPGVDVIFTRDASAFIREAVHSVQEHLVLGGICAAIVVFFFLGSIRSTLIAAVAIPVSIVSTYSLILWMGFTLNRMTLLALTLAVGIVIDDAIVVLENIFRFIEEKNMDPIPAAKAATAEVGLAVSATTLSLVVIFVPVAFIHGVMGRFLNSFGLTMAFAIMVSLLVSFTLTPMLCSRYLKGKSAGGAKHNGSKDWKIFRWIEDYYAVALRWSLDHRWALVVASVALVVSIPFLGKLVGATFLPDDDSSEFAVNIRTQPGYSLAHTDQIVAQIEDRLRTIPEVRDLFTTVGDTNGDDRVTVAEVDAKLFPLGQRRRSQELVMADARKLMDAFPALRVSVDSIKPWEEGGYHEMAVEYAMRGPDLETLRTYADSLMTRLAKIPGIVDLDSSYEGGLPELQVNIDRSKSADLGVSVDDIAQTMRTMVQGDVITRFREGQDTYDVRLQLAAKDRNNPVVVAGLTIPSSKVGQVRLDNVATLTHGTGPVEIDRQDRQRNVSIVFNLAPGFAMNKVMDAVTREVKQFQLPPGYITTFGGQSKYYSEMVAGFVIAFLLSIIFMYMVLAAQFESFVHPITIMLSLPLAVPFALISLLVFREHLMLFSTLGILLLFGIVKKNSILQLDQTLNLLRTGMARRQAILTANRDRLRPILMTTAALVAGMIPVAIGQGAGDSSIRAIALVVIGGQTLCLLITLLITPVAFSLFDDMENWLRNFRKPPARLKLVEPLYDEPDRHALN
ncbi:efflux RND transporter permease subunit [Candidatus Binatus sp.]|uniref:efflux RND transporter permease subunit n=1 Tax=Candidatus Binatus sp. TaxID=2811406 RepID=UPI002F95C5F3